MKKRGISLLVSLHVKNFAIINEVEVYFKDHLNIMTGETGAGKSIIIGSVNAALGAKINKDIVRKGAEYALIELVFETKDETVFQMMRELDIPIEGEQIIISRKIMSRGVLWHGVQIGTAGASERRHEDGEDS
jgi:DNA repair protein RecN (Recombination protein N)